MKQSHKGSTIGYYGEGGARGNYTKKKFVSNFDEKNQFVSNIH